MFYLSCSNLLSSMNFIFYLSAVCYIRNFFMTKFHPACDRWNMQYCVVFVHLRIGQMTRAIRDLIRFEGRGIATRYARRTQNACNAGVCRFNLRMRQGNRGRGSNL